MLLLCLNLFPSGFLAAQTRDSIPSRLPDVPVMTLDYRTIRTHDLPVSGKPMILVFWKSCCLPNINMLDAISDVYEEWQEKTGVILYAVSTDDARSSAGVGPLAHGKGWEFIILLDPNADFKRAMHVNDTPHIFIFDKGNRLVWQKATYIEGDENEIFKILKTL